MTFNPIVVDPAGAVLDGSLVPDPWWRHPDDGRTVSQQQLRRLTAHREAWREVKAGDGVRLVLEAGAGLLPAQHEAVAALLAADLGDAVAVLGDPLGSAYALGATAAGRLLEVVSVGTVSTLDALFARSGLDLVRTEPSLSEAPPALEGHEPAVAHLHVVAPGTEPTDWPSSELVLVLPPDATVVGSPSELLEAFAGCQATVIVPDDPGSEAVMALVGSWRDGVEPVVDRDHELFLPAGVNACWMNGRATDEHRGTRPPVVLGAVPPTDPVSTDLVRVLRYDDAIDRREQCREAAAELFVLPFWTPEFCATVIRAAEAMEAWDSHPDDDVPGAEISLAAISPRLFAHVEDHLAGWILPQLQQEWPHVRFAGIQDAFVIKYTPEGAAELAVHHDISQVSAAVRLNHGFEGGVLEFPRQRYDNADVPVGSMLTWPSLVTHPHRSTPITRGVKYSLTVWWNLPESYRRS